MSGTKLRVLCLDIEGGHGGSSRSLFESLKAMDRAAVDLEVWCRRAGPIQARYQALGIACRVTPGMPRFNAWRRTSRNVIGFFLLARDLFRWRLQRRDLRARIKADFDVVHFNHEGLAWLARCLRGRHGRAQVIHVRTIMNDNFFGRRQARAMAAAADGIVFITENERENFAKLCGRTADGAVIYNAAPAPGPVELDPRVPRDGHLNVAVLSNYAFIRGIDRVVDVALALKAQGRCGIRFVVAGDMKLAGRLDGALGRIARAGGTLGDYAQSMGVADMFAFLGHVDDPDRVLAACDVLIKPTREYNPWGRDILEGLAAGKPVISIGTYSRFVETGRTGYLFPEYDAGKIADAIQTLHSDRDLLARLGAEGARRVAALCAPEERAADLLAVWRQAAAARAARGVTP